jgi:hypothetical protein
MFNGRVAVAKHGVSEEDGLPWMPVYQTDARILFAEPEFSPCFTSWGK